jgi:hypothetical protein
MDIPNAFLGKATQPTNDEVATALGPSAPVWGELLDWLAKEKGVSDHDWKSSSPKYGWTLRVQLKKRNILYLSPCPGCFRVSLVLGDRAMAAARQTKLPKSIRQALDDAPHYAEGTGVRLIVRESKDLAAIRALATIKLEH